MNKKANSTDVKRSYRSQPKSYVTSLHVTLLCLGRVCTAPPCLIQLLLIIIYLFQLIVLDVTTEFATNQINAGTFDKDYKYNLHVFVEEPECKFDAGIHLVFFNCCSGLHDLFCNSFNFSNKFFLIVILVPFEFL